MASSDDVREAGSRLVDLPISLNLIGCIIFFTARMGERLKKTICNILIYTKQKTRGHRKIGCE